MAATLSTFTASLESAGAGWTRTDAAGFASALDDVVERPAVGAALPFDGVSLPDDVARDPTPSALEAASTGVTPARLAVADYGSVLLGSADDAFHASLFPGRHVAVVAASDVVPDMAAAFDALGSWLGEERGDVVIATGPSATADMGELVRGAHGPREVHVVVLEDR